MSDEQSQNVIVKVKLLFIWFRKTALKYSSFLKKFIKNKEMLCIEFWVACLSSLIYNKTIPGQNANSKLYINFDVTLMWLPQSDFGKLREIHCIKSARIRSYSSPYSVRMREIRTRITPTTDTFYAVIVTRRYSEKIAVVKVFNKFNGKHKWCIFYCRKVVYLKVH